MFRFKNIIRVLFSMAVFVIILFAVRKLPAQTAHYNAKFGNPVPSAAAPKVSGHYHGYIPQQKLLPMPPQAVIPPQQIPPQMVPAQTVPVQADFGYPDPRFVRPPERIYTGTPPAGVHHDRYAGIPEPEVQRRIEAERYMYEMYGAKPVKSEECPLCKDDPQTPCGKCKMCLAGFPCERTLCRHCIQPRSQNMCNNCDLTAGDKPCGTCDACREHRSDPCEHADDGHGPKGEFNPYKEPRFMSVIPRPIMDMYNNGARKFPVYYNPAPYYRPHWNPSLFAGYARPYTFRWSCPLCFKNPCECDKPGFAGQVPYAYTCKFCGRNPCACAQDICNVTKELNPKGIRRSLAADEKKTSSNPQDAEERQKALNAEKSKQGAVLSDVAEGTQEKVQEGGSSPLLDEAKPDTLDLLELPKNTPKNGSGNKLESRKPDVLDAP